MTKKEVVLFDLDGTLADTALDLGAALNRLLKEKGMPEVAMEKIRPIASHGANGLIQLGAGVHPEHPEHAQWRQAYLDEYAKDYTSQTILFAGINELIADLVAEGVRWGIITNKPERFTHGVVEKLGFACPPEVVVCGDTCAEAKPSVLPMHYACDQLGVAPEACLYVGDAERDMEAGKKAGMSTVLVSWGYIAPDDKVEEWLVDARVDTPDEIKGLLG